MQAKPAKAKKGVSLLIGIVLIAIIAVFAMGVSALVTSGIRNAANVNRANEAYYAAEGALEEGLLMNAKQGAGYTVPATAVELCETGDNCPAAKVTVQGTVPSDLMIGQEYVIPTPGTGNAGTNCNPLIPVISNYFTYPYSGTTYTEDDPFEHPCNWNKIKVGESVSIPLYRTDSNGKIINPLDMRLESLKVKIRTPCKNGAEMCPFIDRYLLDTQHGDEDYICPTNGANCGDTIVSWQITGTDMKGTNTYAMVANDSFFDTTMVRFNANSEIYEWLINEARSGGGVSSLPGFNCEATPYCVLYERDGGQRMGKDLFNNGVVAPIYNFLLNQGDYKIPGLIREMNDDMINKPVLKLSVIHSLNDKEYPDSPVPYLEYQITSKHSLSGGSPSDLTQTITAEGVSRTFKQVLEVKQPQESGLLEYVIQQ